jgi:ABC-type glycerol-3-phosphate transport system substrate-binding protein
MKRLFFLILVILVALGACSILPNAERSPSSTPLPGATAPTNPDAVTISFAASNQNRRTYEILAQQFMTDHPDINVVIVSQDDLTQIDNNDDTPLKRLHRVVSGADTASISYFPPEAYDSNLLLNLQPLMDADPDFHVEDFYPSTLERFSTTSGTWALPHYVHMDLLHYNKDLFAQANVQEPQPGWSWEDMLDTAEQLAQKRGDTVEIYGLTQLSDDTALLLMELLQAQGIDLFHTPIEEWQFDQPEVVTALERMRILVNQGALFWDFADREEQILRERPPEEQFILDGQMGMWTSFRRLGTYSIDGTFQAKSLPFEMGKVPYPASEESHKSVSGYIISGGTAHPNAAWQWIEFLSQQPNPQMQLQFGSIPARESVVEAVNIWSDVTAEERTAYEWILQQSPAQQSMQRGEMFVNGQYTLYDALEAVLEENTPIDAALTDAQTQLTDIVMTSPTSEADTLSAVTVATPGPQAPPPDTTPLHFGVSPDQRVLMQQKAVVYQQQNPAVFVQVNEITDTDIAAVAQTNDCFLSDSPPTTPADLQALIDLQPLIDADQQFAYADYPQALLNAYRHDGRLYGLTHTFNIDTIYYNTTAFDAAGLSPPDIEWTPNDFLLAAQALTTGEGQQKTYGYVPVNSSRTVADLFFFIQQHGAQLTSGSGDNLRPNFDDPDVVMAIQWYLDLYTVHHVMPQPVLAYSRDDTTTNDNVSEELFYTGAVGMWLDKGTTNISFPVTFSEGRMIAADGTDLSDNIDSEDSVNDSSSFAFDMAPLPVGQAGLSANDFEVSGFHISAQTQDPQVCWEWLKFVTSDVRGVTRDIPARISQSTSDDFATQSPQAGKLVQMYAPVLEQANQPVVANDMMYQLDFYWFFKAVYAAIQGEQELATGLATAQTTTEEFLACTREGAAAHVCAQQVDPDYAGFNQPPEADAP